MNRQPVICEKCIEKNAEQPREATHAHYLHWKEKPLKRGVNHRELQKKHPELFKNLCTLCHAEVHDIEPKMSELKRAVVLRDRTIQQRVRLENQIRGLSAIELRIPVEFEDELKNLELQEKQYEKEVKTQVDALPKNLYPVDWMLSIKGISHVTVGKILSSIDNPLLKGSKTTSIQGLRRYAGLDPTRMRRPKGITAKQAMEYGCGYLKKEALLLADNLQCQRADGYREIFDETKKNEIDLAKQFGYGVEIPWNGGIKTTVKTESHFETNKKTGEPREVNSQANDRALRRVAQAFFKDLYSEWKKLDQPWCDTQRTHV